jgi:hypothetical protein
MRFDLLTDAATLRSAIRALTHHALESAAGDEAALVDIDIANLAKLVDDIVLAERLLYLPGQRDLTNDGLALLGDALTPLELPHYVSNMCAKEAGLRMSRLATLVDLFNLVGVIPRSFWTRQLHGTLTYLVFQGLGVREKYSDLMASLVRHKGLDPADVKASPVRYHMTSFGTSRPSVSDLRSDHLSDWSYFAQRLEEEQGLPSLDFSDGDEGQIQSGDSRQASGYRQGVAISAEMQPFATRVLWLYLRGHYYRVVGQAVGVAYSPHSLRAPLLEHAVLGSALVENESEAVVSVRRRLMGILMDRVNDDVGKTLEFYGATVSPMKFPALFYHVALKADRPDQIMAIAYDVRASKAARRFRAECANVVEAFQSGDVKRLARLRRQVETLVTNLQSELGAGSVTPAEVKIGYGPLAMTGKFQLPAILRRQFFPFQGHLAFLRNIYQDLARVAALGSAYDRLFWPRKAGLRRTASAKQDNGETP